MLQAPIAEILLEVAAVEVAMVEAAWFGGHPVRAPVRSAHHLDKPRSLHACALTTKCDVARRLLVLANLNPHRAPGTYLAWWRNQLVVPQQPEHLTEQQYLRGHRSSSRCDNRALPAPDASSGYRCFCELCRVCVWK